MDFGVYHLQALSAFHFGLRGVELEATATHAPSDTLFSALCHALREQFGLACLQEFLLGFAEPEPPVTLSSAFPYALARGEKQEDWVLPRQIEAGQAVRFFPRPLDWPPGLPDLADERKNVKGIEWVSETLFRGWINGENLSAHWRKENWVHDKHVWLTEQERQQIAGWRDEDSDEIRLWTVGDVPRVTVDRRHSGSAVYQAGQLRFQPGGGLWLLARWHEDWRQRGETALRVLGETGIGGERSSGYGQFILHGPHSVAALPEPIAGERFVTLALYFPKEQELPAVLKDERVSYRLRVRRGWMSSPDQVQGPGGKAVRGSALRRRAVRMFAEGSLLYWPEGRTTLGDLADVTPEAFDPARGGHNVWRYGYALPVRYRGGA